jgi:hypothetical protein
VLIAWMHALYMMVNSLACWVLETRLNNGLILY